MKRQMKQLKRLIAFILCISIFISQSGVSYAEGDNTKPQEVQENVVSQGTDNETEDTEGSTTEITGEAPEDEQVEEPEQNVEEEKEPQVDVSKYYCDGRICIYNYDQLQLIGSGNQVFTGDIDGNTGAGEVVSDGDSALTYSLDGQYKLMNDIELDTEHMWSLPEGFSGSFQGNSIDENAPLYEKETDTIYIYHNYQLKTLLSENAEQEPVMSKDMIASEFGMGQFIYPDGTEDGQNYLKYDSSHNYVLSVDFTEQMPELTSISMLSDGENKYGRAYEGQIIYKDTAGTEYILIGNRKQLRQIGKKEGETALTAGHYVQVTGAAYSKLVIGNQFTLEYCGDADLDWSEKNNKGELPDKSYDINVGIWYGLDENGVPAVSMRGKYKTGKTYSPDEHYIIFKDIYLTTDGTSTGTTEAWDPIDDFTGTMEGRLNMEEGKNAAIHNVTIDQSAAIDQGSNLLGTATNSEFGVGFFRNLSTPYDSNLTISASQISVSNLTLDNVIVSMSTSEIKRDTSLIGTLVGGALKILGLDSGLEPDPKSLATGTLAGVVNGNVSIKNCNVTNLQGVSNTNDWTGGLIGYSSGITRYSALSGSLQYIAEALGQVLNIIPVLGLGDLITILLGGVLKVGDLIPVGYTNAVISDCTVSYSQNAEVQGNNYTGGLVGQSEGTVFTNCQIDTTGTNTISGNDYTGGFAGEASNAVIVGALQGLGVNIAEFPANTVILNSKIAGNGIINVTANTTASNAGYAGGFAGSMGNSYAVDCGVTCLGTVKGKDYTGGFAGKASTGDLADIDENKGLLELVQRLLSTITTGDNAQLLNLVGIRPSVITGCTVSGAAVHIIGSGEYAGGLVGYAGAVQISNTDELSNQEKETTKVFDKVLAKNNISYNCTAHQNSLNLSTSLEINATTHAGGVIGKGTMTSVTDVLSNTVSAADYMRFELKDVTVNAGTTGMTVTATATDSYAGGVLGEGIGGEVRNVSLTNLSGISAQKYAGGFAGSFGSGTLAQVGGVNLLGLDLLQIDGLLSLGDMIETFADNSSVAGLDSGFTVTSNAEDGKSGGFIGYCVSGRTTDCKVANLKSAVANTVKGEAGGFIGSAKAGDAVSTAGKDANILGDAVKITNLLGVVSALTPEFNGSSVSYVANGDNPQIEAYMAGGFLGDGEAVDINYSANHPSAAGEGSGTDTTKKATQITGLKNIRGVAYAGGFAGRLQPGDIAQTGSLKLLKILDVTQLLTVMDVAYPRISDSEIKGADDGLTVTAEGETGNTSLGDAGGYIGSAKAVSIENSNVSKVKSINGTYHAGGYVGLLKAGTAADAGDTDGNLLNTLLGKIVDINKLASVLQMGSSEIINSKVSGVNTGMTVTAACREGNDETNAQTMAGGYVGEMQSGTVDNTANAGNGKGTAVENLLKVEGLRYAGGFGGLVKAGAVAEVGENTSLLGNAVNLTQLVSVLNAFVPIIKNASVRSVADDSGTTADDQASKGFTAAVTGTYEKDSTNDSNTGSAGGFIGYGCGVQITDSDVNMLANTKVAEPADLQSTDGSAYFGNGSAYAVKGYRYAGGYFGKSDIGSTATVGGANVLDKLIHLGDAASALDIVLTTVEDSDVHGAPGGFNVLASNADGKVGKAGGFAGTMLGSALQDSNVYNFAHIIGRESAGGYVGTMEPGSVASVLGDENSNSTTILAGAISAENLISVLRSFVPSVRNSETVCIPCGGVVRADAESAGSTKRGLAGGYAGYNLGGQIKGQNADKWLGSAYTGEQRVCGAVRIRSVYGTEYAGGYTGLMECANTADTGSLNVLYGLINLSSPLQALQAVYATEENTAVYGPLQRLDVDTWNRWVTSVGSYGAYGNMLKGLGNVTDGNTLKEYIAKYSYGYEVTAGRSTQADTGIKGGAAGGYAGRMEGGTITNAQAYDLKSAEAYRSAGGFVGEMKTGTVAQTGGIDLAGLNVIDNLGVLDTFVPVIKNSSAAGYKSGAVINAVGIKLADNDLYGLAGGYVGSMTGGQIWGKADSRCKITGLRRVNGTSYVGGYAGKVDPGSLTEVDTNTDKGLLNKILNQLINTKDDLAKVLNATVATIRYADAESWDDWGVVVNGVYTDNSANTAYANAAGGFAGALSGAVLGEEKEAGSGVTAKQIRSVTGGYHAGGCFGIADVASVAEVSAGTEATNILKLVQAGSVDVLDTFRTYVYHSSVTGSTDAGLSIASRLEYEITNDDNTKTHLGNAGGFGGSLLDGSVKDSSVTNLSNVNALDCTGGFIGYTGKSGVLDIDEVNVGAQDSPLNLLGGTAGVLDVFGSNIHNCSVAGTDGGYTVASEGGSGEKIAGGFVGYGNLARIVDCDAGKKTTDGTYSQKGLKQVYSDEIAGGFAGKTNYAYLGDVALDSTLLNIVLNVVNGLVRMLYLDKIENWNLVNIGLPGVLQVKAASDGNLLYVDLLGLKIAVALSKGTGDGRTDVAEVTIGDSTIALPCDKDGVTGDGENNVRITLIKSNRTKIEGSTVTGTSAGYDVYGGKAQNSTQGTEKNGYSGGFVGYNVEGLLENNNMYYCDAIAGASDTTGPFTGVSSLESSYDFNKRESIEGNGNVYRIYRHVAADLSEIVRSGKKLNDDFQETAGWGTYILKHTSPVADLKDLMDAVITSGTARAAQEAPLSAYISPAKAVLMDDVRTEPNKGDSDTPEPSDMQDPCDEFVTLTINKKWVDHNNADQLRPNPAQIIVTLSRTWEESGETRTEMVPGYENYEWNGDINKNTWQITLPASQDQAALPAYKTDESGNVHYYTYSVTETPVPEYTTEISSSEDGFTFTITNTHLSPLPDTGGMGNQLFILVGMALLILWAAMTTGKRKREGRCYER